MNDAALILRLREENETLAEENRQLREAMIEHFVAPREWRLTPAESKIFGALLRREACSREVILHATERSSRVDYRDPKIIDVMITRLRQKLKPLGIKITTIRGIGYSLDDASRRRYRMTSRGAA